MGSAGLRLGYAIAPSDVVAIFDRLRESFNANASRCIAAEAALLDTDHVARSKARNLAERERLADILRAKVIACFRGKPISC